MAALGVTIRAKAIVPLGDMAFYAGEVTMYALRHSSIVRMLLQNVPIRLVASLHNTSVRMIEKHYSRYIVEHSDDISRKALLQYEPPSGENVVALAS